MGFPDALGFETLGDDESDEVYARFYLSLLEHRLPPGTKLPEEKLASVFGVTRAKIRKVFARLEHERIIEAVPNRGSFVAKPTIEEATDTLDARRIIEPELARRLAQRASAADISRLRAHIDAEYAAARENDTPTMIRLAGAFHNVIAELAGNIALARALRPLAALTSLTILLYEAPVARACLPDEHVDLTDAIERGAGDEAAAIMLRHLNAVQESLVFEKTADTVDFDAIFGRVPA